MLINVFVKISKFENLKKVVFSHFHVVFSLVFQCVFCYNVIVRCESIRFFTIRREFFKN